jgi:iron complex outermembrane receptor protein
VLSDEIALLEGRLLLLPALRQEFYHNRLRSDTTGAGLSLDDDSPFTGQLSLRHAATDAVTLKASYGTYYHPPDFTELFGDRGSVIGNDQLEPEKGVNIDGGVRLTHRVEAKPVQVWTEVVRFRTSADDLIQYVFDARGIGRPVNVGEARIDGWELSCGADLAEHVRISHGTTLQEAENRSGLPGQDGNHLPLRARRKHVIRVEPYGKRWRAWLEWSRLGKRHLDTANLIEMEEQEIVNAGVALTWRSLKLSLEVRNVRDEQVSDIGGYPLPGRLVLGTLEYSF